MYQPQPQVLSTMPQNLSTSVDTRGNIIIFFNTDLDRGHISDSIYVLDGLMNKIPIGFSYDNKVVTLSPEPELLSNTTYTVVVKGGVDTSGFPIGVRNIFGTPLPMDYNMTFTTVTKEILPAPTLIFPVNQSIIQQQPAFQWEPVEGAAFYQVKVSPSSSLAPVAWPADSDTNFFPATAATPIGPDFPYQINPSYQFADGTYYWAARAMGADGTFGEWTPVSTFSIDTRVQGAQSPEDVVPLDAVPFYDAASYPTLEIIDSYPQDGDTNLATNLMTVYIQVPGQWDATNFPNSLITLTGHNVDGQTNNADFPDHGNVDFTLTFTNNGDGTTTIGIVMATIDSQAYLPQLQ